MPKKEDAVETDSVIKSTDINPPKVEPKSFEDLTLDELVSAANMFGTETEGDEKTLREDLTLNGVKWNMYVRAFRLPGWEDIPADEPSWPVEVDVEDAPDADEQEVVQVQEVIAAPPVALAADQKYLVKFIGENPYFEFKRYRFTQDNPYAVMPAADAQDALVTEAKKFRQAFPAELQEFYS